MLGITCIFKYKLQLKFFFIKTMYLYSMIYCYKSLFITQEKYKNIEMYIYYVILTDEQYFD